MIRYGFRAPPDVAVIFHLLGEKALVGRTATMSLLGEPHHKVRILSAATVDNDDMLGPGVWLTVEAVDMPDDVLAVENARVTGDDGRESDQGPPAVIRTVTAVRVRRLDADGNPAGEWIPLGDGTYAEVIRPTMEGDEET